MIERKKLIDSHNPVLTGMETDAPLTVGNGELAFTADITGMQTLYRHYDVVPLCTMSQWGWHTEPTGPQRETYTLADLAMTEYEWNGRRVIYPKKKMPGNEAVYDWLRENPHRLNLMRAGFVWEDREMEPQMVEGCRQELCLYEGILESRFAVLGRECLVHTACDMEGRDRLAFLVESRALAEKKLGVALEFPYGSPDISGSDWGRPESHETRVVYQDSDGMTLRRALDGDVYTVWIRTNGTLAADEANHRVTVKGSSDCLELTVEFARGEAEPKEISGREKAASPFGGAAEVMERSRSGWRRFWEEGGIIRLADSRDVRAKELERRIVLSQYLMAVNSAGSAPPQETGLTCNSWYGKMHLEMYLWHCAWLPLFGHGDRMEKSVVWYRSHLPEARENAARNGYKGARWPKMVALEGVDCPSPVAPLLVWQQPHIIYMLELAYRQGMDGAYLERNWNLVEETAAFMADFVVWNGEIGCYDICPPVIPVQECHKETETKNPAFEVEYWSVTLRIAAAWAARLHRPVPEKWLHVAEHMAGLKEKDGYYLAHEYCPDTFTRFNRDHPSMVGAFGLIDSERVDPKTMERTLDRILACWEDVTLWGWDFAMMAMTAVRLGKPELAVDILMKDTPKNCYLKNGHNMQKTRKDLPLYLPGNGSLLLAAAMMTAGYEGCEKPCPGFPDDGMWTVEYEGIAPFPGEM